MIVQSDVNRLRFDEILSEARIEKFFFEELLPMKWFSHFLYLYLHCHR